MGGYYAAKEGLDPQVAAAIRDHYKPVGQGDDVPTDPVTVAVSLADKLDTLAMFFEIDEKPTGSKDPFALRRAALGVISLVTVNQLRLPIVLSVFKAVLSRIHAQTIKRDGAPVVTFAAAMADLVNVENAKAMFDAFASLTKATPSTEKQKQEVLHRGVSLAAEVRDFIIDRFEVTQRQSGNRVDVIRAAKTLDLNHAQEDDLVRLLARVHALQAFVETGEGGNLLAGYKRAANILKKEGFTPLPVGEGQGASAPRGEGDAPASATSSPPSGEGLEPAEQALIDALNTAEPRAIAAIEAEDFEGAMAALAVLRAPIDAFFDDVTVNDADPAKRAARLGLLARFRAAVHRVADFSKIEG